MPTVPRAQRTVESVAMPNAYAPSPSIIQSPDFVTPTNKVFATAEKIMQEEVNKVNQVALLDADTQLSQEKLRIDLEAAKYKGKDAAGAIDYATKEWSEATKRIEKGLGNDAQRLAFSGRKQSHWTELDSRIQKHAAVERQDYDNKTADAWVNNTIEWTVANHKDPGLVEGSLSSLDAVLNDHVARNGIDPESAKALKAGNVEKLHTSVINRMLADGDYLAARDYLKGHSASITDPAIRKKVAVASSDGEGARIEEEAWVKYGPKKPGDPVNEYDMALYIDKSSGGDTSISNAGKSFSKERVALWNAQVKSNEDASKAKIWRAVADGASLTNIKRMPEYLNLDGKEANTVKEHVIDRANTLAGRQSEKTTPAQDVAYWRLHGRVDTMSEDEILSLYPTLGPKRTNDLMEAKTKLSDATEKYTTMTLLQSVDTRWEEMGFAKDGEQGKAHAAFKTAVFDRVNLLEKTTLGGKRKANHEETTTIINELALKNILIKYDPGYIRLEKEVPYGEVPSGAAVEGVRFAPSKKDKVLTRAGAEEYVRRAGGDKNKARELARKEGYKF